MPEIPNKSAFSQNDLDALFANGGQDIQQAMAPGAASAKPAPASPPASSPAPETKPASPVAPAPVAAALTLPQPPKPAPPAPAPALAQPTAAAPILAPPPSAPPKPAVAMPSLVVPAAAPQAPANPASPASPPLPTAAAAPLLAAPERSHWIWAIAGFASGLALAFGLILFLPPAVLRSQLGPHPLPPAESMVSSTASHETPSPEPKNAVHALKHTELANPQQQILVGTPMSVLEQFNNLDGYGVSQLKCTGYSQEGSESVPVITLVAVQQTIPDKLVCTSSSTADLEVNGLLNAGYSPKFSLVSLPVFRLDSGKPSKEWSIFALQKSARRTTAKMTLFDTTPRTAQVFKDLLRQGWKITSIEGRPVEIQAAHPQYPSTMTAVFLEMP